MVRARRRQSAGFTIIEVLVALTLLAAVILLVTRAFLTVLSVTSQGGRVTVEVFFQGGGQPVARMTSAIMRGAYHR